MTIFEFLILLLIATICGTIGQSIAGYSLGGWLISAGVGFIGAIIGKWIAGELDLGYLIPLNVDGEMFPIAWAILGSVLFTVVVGVLSRKK